VSPTDPNGDQPEPPAEERHDPYAAFRVRDYRLYAFGSIIAFIGHQIQGVAIGWEIYERTGAALSLGLVGGVQAIPLLLLALPAGHLADVFNRRNIIILSQFLAASCSLGLAALSYCEGPISGMYLLLLLNSTVVTLGRPARQALLPQLVPAEIFSNAMTWNSSLFQVASVVGPALGGFVILVSIPLAYVIDAIFRLVFMALMFGLKPRKPKRDGEGLSLTSFLAGVDYVWKRKVILSAISLDMFAVLLGGAVYLLPIFAKDILEVGEWGFGWLRAAPGVGAFCMALLLAHLPPIKRAGRALLLGVAAFGVATIIFGISRSFWLSMAMLFLTGAFDNISVVVRHTLVQMLTPDEMRGRVSAVNSVFIGSSNELGGMESGLTAEWLGVVWSVVVGGIGTIGVVGLTAWLCPSIRKFGSLKDAKPDQ